MNRFAVRRISVVDGSPSPPSNLAIIQESSALLLVLFRLTGVLEDGRFIWTAKRGTPEKAFRPLSIGQGYELVVAFLLYPSDREEGEQKESISPAEEAVSCMREGFGHSMAETIENSGPLSPIELQSHRIESTILIFDGSAFELLLKYLLGLWSAR